MIYNIIDIENTKQNIRLRNKMVKDYLEKIRQEYIEHKVSSGFREGNKSRV